MEKKIFIGIAGSAIVLIALGIYLAKQKGGSQLDGIIDVDEVVEYPERFTGHISVAGRVIEIEESKGFFILGCEDACVRMPVRYEGHLPEAGKDVFVAGELKKDENGKYFFEAKEVKEK
ncbi:MAG: hypothetical protein QW279_08690 [Candidatus Jordarchaeaceae archaeon]